MAFEFDGPNGKEIKFSCQCCHGTGCLPALVQLLTEPYDIYRLCDHCGGKGYHIMYEINND
jgi:DnaJ-class molecular chaperone